MRITISIDARIANAMKRLARSSGKSLSRVVNETLRAGLAKSIRRPNRPYRLKPISLGGALAGVDLTKALQINTEIEYVEIARKLELGR